MTRRTFLRLTLYASAGIFLPLPVLAQQEKPTPKEGFITIPFAIGGPSKKAYLPVLKS